MTDIKHVECEECGKEIGTTNYVIAYDGVTNRTVTFHKACEPTMSDVQRHFGVTLDPAKLGFSLKGFL